MVRTFDDVVLMSKKENVWNKRQNSLKELTVEQFEILKLIENLHKLKYMILTFFMRSRLLNASRIRINVLRRENLSQEKLIYF